MKERAKDLGLTIDVSQCRSWRDCFRVIKYRFFGRLKFSQKYYWEDLTVAFEFMLPKRKKEPFHKRIDWLIFSERMIIVVEFKRRKTQYDGFLRQNAGYCRRIRKMLGPESDITVKGVLCYTEMEPELILTTLKDPGQRLEVIRICSQDTLTDALLDLLGDCPSPPDDDILDQFFPPKKRSNPKLNGYEIQSEYLRALLEKYLHK